MLATLNKWKAKLKLKLKYGWSSTMFKALLSSYDHHETYTSKDGTKYLIVYIPDDEIPQTFGLTKDQIFMMSVNFMDNPHESAILAGEANQSENVEDMNIELIMFTTENTRIQLANEVFHALCEHEIGHLKRGHFITGKHVNNLKHEMQADYYASKQIGEKHVLEYLNLFLTYDGLNKTSFQKRKKYIEAIYNKRRKI